MARLMSSTELHQRMESNSDFILVDVHQTAQFEREHIPGAINIPLDALANAAPTQLNKNQRIIVYGDNHETEASSRAAELLESLGYRKVSDFDGGLHAWKRAGYRTSVDA